MTREQQLVFCKKCVNKKIDFQRGLLCGLTNELATFDYSCPDYLEIQENEVKSGYTLQKAKGPFAASQGKRFINFFIDRFLIFGMGALFGAVLGALWMTFSPNNFLELELFLDNKLAQYAIGVFLSLLYYSFFEGITGRSIGKYFTKTRVVDENGDKPTFNAIFIRSLCRFIPFEAFSFLGDNAIGWHDSMSKTRVVDVED